MNMCDKYGHRKVLVNCKDCDTQMERRADSFKNWSGRCVSCAKLYRKNNAKGRIKKSVAVCCALCGVKWDKREDGLKKWKGYCLDCSHSVKHSTDAQKKRCREHMAAVRKKYGGVIPNVQYKRGDKHQNWKGGLPKCIDCGKGVSLYTVKRCSDCYHKARVGENHPNWKGGKSGENVRVRQSKEYSVWRSEVFQRDGWCCIICGYRSKKRGDIKADHIKPFHLFPELRLDTSNGRTLCLNCDYVYGYNHNRDKAKIVNISVDINKNISWRDIEKIV